MAIRTFYTVFLLLIAIIAGAGFVAGCDQEDRHKLLTFFVDGVPPIGGWDPNDPNSPDYRNNLKGSSANANQQQTNAVGSYHEPRKECNLCHENIPQESMPGSADLVENEPDLCYNCHTDYTKDKAYVHGPVAVGECLFCHLPHKSKNRYLLKKPIPDICFTCHDREMINEIPDHNPELLGKCNFCHHAHSGSKKGLLKMNSKRGTKLDYKFGG